MFADSIFKYASSLEKHLPQFKAARAGGSEDGEPSPKELLMDALVDNSRNPHNTCEIGAVQAALSGEDTPPLLIDVRASEIYAQQHLPGAVNIPMAALSTGDAELPLDRDTPIVTVCNRGNMSLSGMLLLQSLGYRNVQSLNGGTIGWAEAGLPTE